MADGIKIYKKSTWASVEKNGLVSMDYGWGGGGCPPLMQEADEVPGGDQAW